MVTSTITQQWKATSLKAAGIIKAAATSEAVKEISGGAGDDKFAGPGLVRALASRFRDIIQAPLVRSIARSLLRPIVRPPSALSIAPYTSPAQNNPGIGRKTKNEFFRGLPAPWGFGEHPKTHTFLESTCPEVNETGSTTYLFCDRKLIFNSVLFCERWNVRIEAT